MRKLVAFVAFATITASMPAVANDNDHDKGSNDMWFSKMDSNNDGKITKAENDAFAQKKFAKMDTNNDGTVSKSEFAEHKAQEHDNMTNKPDSTTDGTGSNKNNKGGNL